MTGNPQINIRRLEKRRLGCDRKEKRRNRSSDDSILSKLSKNYGRDEIGISVISIQELYEGKSTISPTKENQMMAIIGQLTVLPYDVDVARLAGKIARDGKNIIDLADAAIAATTIINEAELCTLNGKHFQSIPNLKLFSSKV